MLYDEIIRELMRCKDMGVQKWLTMEERMMLLMERGKEEKS